ncbi:hypothetical protein PVAND_007873 [Polypedilum vanderplanki]|uniref:Uncharacterized protein n=1 Tax=Polypedilum vanderplanki TaxID=319348 RepID=A0A9J6C7N9_POLVA|nr:hypothetical protein PVAND_007873 [Polypedilum vanderplanki]
MSDFWLSLVTIFGLFIVGTYQKSIILYMYDVTITFDENIMNCTLDFKCKTNTRENPCDYAPGIEMKLLQPIPKPFVQFKMIDISQNQAIVDQTILICNLRGDNGLDLIMKIMWEQISKHMDFLISCPFKARTYSVKPYKLQMMNFLIPLLSKNKPIQQTTIVKMRVGKKIQEVFRYDAKMEFIDVD